MALSRYSLCSFSFFKQNVVLKKEHTAKESSYFTFHFDGIEIKFCISTHLSEHRSRLLTVFSKDRSKANATKIAYDIYIQRRKDWFDEMYG